MITVSLDEWVTPKALSALQKSAVEFRLVVGGYTFVGRLVELYISRDGRISACLWPSGAHAYRVHLLGHTSTGRLQVSTFESVRMLDVTASSKKPKFKKPRLPRAVRVAHGHTAIETDRPYQPVRLHLDMPEVTPLLPVTAGQARESAEHVMASDITMRAMAVAREAPWNVRRRAARRRRYEGV